MSEGIGLRPLEMRALGMSCRATMFSMFFAVLFAGFVVGPHWVVLAWVAGAVLARTALRFDGARRDPGASDSRVRRLLARICRWEPGAIAGVAMLCAVLWVAWEFYLCAPGLLARLEALPDDPMTKAAFIAATAEALCETWRLALENAELPIALVGIFGIADMLLCGLADWLLVSAVGARHGVSPWRAMGFGRGSKDWKRFARRERARRRRLLTGEGSK